MAAWGRDINLYELAGGRRTAEAASARAAWTGDIAPIVQLEGGEGVLLDGLFGAGLSRPLAGEALEAVMRAARVQGPKVAIDLPSGLQGDGAAHAACAPADITVTFGALKPVHVLQPAAQACGRVVVEEIGFGACLGRPNVHLNGPELWRLQWPTPTSHKHQRGRLFVVTGGLASTGAARLAARAGLRLCGSSTLLCPPAAMIVVAQSVEAVMTRSFDGPAALVEASERAQAVVIGPAAGVDAKTRANVEALGQAGRRLVLDADALSVFAGEATALK
jgi:NAD(P)H-hydrate repair Nnr-like enzyme with NAD(P)H-hydrate dehydratase domain